MLAAWLSVAAPSGSRVKVSNAIAETSGHQKIKDERAELRKAVALRK